MHIKIMYNNTIWLFRLVGNSDGVTNNEPIEIIHGDNYADGNYHQVNVKMGEFTKVDTYTFPQNSYNQTQVSTLNQSYTILLSYILLHTSL